MDAARRVLFSTVGMRNQEFPDLHMLGNFLKRCLSAVAVVDGHEIAPLGGDAEFPFSRSVGPRTLRNAGCSAFLLYDVYQDAIMRAGGPAHARFDLDVLHAIVPPTWVPIVAALIADGPDIGAARGAGCRL